MVKVEYVVLFQVDGRKIRVILLELISEDLIKDRRTIMATPRFSLDEICTKVFGLRGQSIESLTGRSYHRIVSVDPAKKDYEIEYPSGNRIVVSLNDLYALYGELYAHGFLTASSVKKDLQRILGWKTWHAPGRALFAILPHVDDSIRKNGGELELGVQS